jgi:hypothetical protein
MTFDESPPDKEPKPERKRPPSFDERPPRNRFERRMARIREEVERNRRGEAAIPTWVLALILVALIGGITLVLVVS